MELKIALAGNPNSGKTTMFNALTGSNQYVGNWPGVTVEKKEGRYKADKEIVIQDLPGIYSLSPYTLEEVVARNYLINEQPDAILNIVDGTNVERNLYLTTQLLELGLPVVVALNMMDVVRKNGDTINAEKLAGKLGCPVVEIAAINGDGINTAMEKVIALAKNTKTAQSIHAFDAAVEAALGAVEALLGEDVPTQMKRFVAVKYFERDEMVAERFPLTQEGREKVEEAITACEEALDDDSESIMTNERYQFIKSAVDGAVSKKNTGETLSDKIDRLVTNRILALPIFAVVMVLVYYISITGLGGTLTDWANDGVFGEGWRLFGLGNAEYEEAVGVYEIEDAKIQAYIEAAEEAGVDAGAMKETLEAQEADESVIAQFMADAAATGVTARTEIEGEEGETPEVLPVDAGEFALALAAEEPDPAKYGVWVPGIPVLVEGGLDAIGTADWLKSLILDGIIGGVGAILGFVPQMLILFLLLAFLEDCGYMSRIAFIMDRVFRRFGLSGKSFIPMMIGMGCGVPGIMASRTIEQDRDRKMTIMTTTFIPCGAKMPIVALIAGAMFGGAWWVAPSAYFIGVAAIVISGIILKKTKRFAGDSAPFVMELPAYHMPRISALLRSMWERGWSFIKKAGTVIFLASIVVWFTSNFGFVNGTFGMIESETYEGSILRAIGDFIKPIFAPLGFASWESSVATVLGLVAKEEVVAVFGVLYGVAGETLELVEVGAFSQLNAIAGHFTALSAYSFLIFNLLCAPCFAAIGAMRREFNNAGWTIFAVTYQTGFAYAAALVIYQLVGLITGETSFGIFTIAAIAVLVALGYFLLRPSPEKKNAKV